jgi:hypothetical protein
LVVADEQHFQEFEFADACDILQLVILAVDLLGAEVGRDSI